MTAIEVNEQINVIRKAGKAANRSKASAVRFLVDAGIIKKSRSTQSAPKKSPTKINK